MADYTLDMREQQIPFPLTTIALAVTGKTNPKTSNVIFRDEYNTDPQLVAGILRALQPVMKACHALAKRLDKGTGKHLRSLNPDGKMKTVNTLAKNVDTLIDTLAFYWSDCRPQYDEALDLIDVLYHGNDDDTATSLDHAQNTDYATACDQLHSLLRSLHHDLKGPADGWKPAHMRAALRALALTGEKLGPVFEHLDRAIEYGPALGPELAELISGNAELSIGSMQFCMEESGKKGEAALRIVDRVHGKILGAPQPAPQIPPARQTPRNTRTQIMPASETPTQVLTGNETTQVMPGGSSLPDTLVMSATTIHVPGHGHVHLTAEQIRAATIGAEPRTIQTYAVEIDGRLWPPRWIIFRALGRDTTDTDPNSQQCMEALHQLGFNTFERSSYSDAGRLIVPAARKRNGK